MGLIESSYRNCCSLGPARRGRRVQRRNWGPWRKIQREDI